MKEDIAMDMDPGIREDLMHELKDAFVDIRTETCIAGVSEEGATLRHRNQDYFFPCDTVVLAIGTKAENALYGALKSDVDVDVVGDAYQARKALEASTEGFYQGLHA
jgi:NADH dehydrogenase FAD-containing subunit